MMLDYLWQRFLLLGWIGKAVTVVVLLYGIGWAFGSIGMEATAREFGSAGAVVLSVLLTALVIRTIWHRHTGRPRL